MNLRSNHQVLEGVSFRRMTEGQIKDIHSASLEILERIGVRIHDEEALNLLKSKNVKITDGNLAYIPPSLVDWALERVPHRVHLWDQKGSRYLALEGRNVFFGTGSDCLNVLDHRTNERRPAVLNDVREAMQVCDSLPNLDFVMSVFLPSDVPVETSYTRQMEVMLLTTTKPIIFLADGLSDCRKCVEMAETVAGGPDALRQRPFIALYSQPVSPLVHNKDTLQKLLFMAEKGLPCLYIPGVKPGMTAPATWAGAMAYSNAGTLTGIVLSQLKREGAPIICRGGAMGTSDMRSMVFAYGAPGGRGFEPELARFYGLPSFGLAGCSDSKVLDGQAVMEASLTLLADALAGANLVHDIGYLESGLTASLPLIVICDEIIGWIKRYMKGLVIDDENLALDVIAEAGPKTDFIRAKHTLKHFKEEWYPDLSDRSNYQGWVSAGKTTFEDRARQKVDYLLKNHTPHQVDEGTKAVLAKLSGR